MLNTPDAKSCPACGQSFLVGGRGRPPRAQVFCSDECKYRGRYRRGRTANTLTPTDAAYLAGLVDGEGSIMLVRRRDTIAPRLTIANTYRPIFDWLSEATGVVAARGQHPETLLHKAGYFWMANGDTAAQIAEQIRPYLKIKHAQAALLVEAMTRLRDPALKADRTWQAEYKARMTELNRRGPTVE